jgi:hypothetical protein
LCRTSSMFLNACSNRGAPAFRHLSPRGRAYQTAAGGLGPLGVLDFDIHPTTGYGPGRYRDALSVKMLPALMYFLTMASLRWPVVRMIVRSRAPAAAADVARPARRLCPETVAGSIPTRSAAIFTILATALSERRSTPTRRVGRRSVGCPTRSTPRCDRRSRSGPEHRPTEPPPRRPMAGLRRSACPARLPDDINQYR